MTLTRSKHQLLRVSERTRYRWLEMLPGLMVWGSLLLSVLASIFLPLWAIVFIILFDLFWAIRVVYIMGYLVLAYRQFRRALRIDWQARVTQFPEWSSIVHLIVIPTHGESLAVLRQTFQSLARMTYPLDHCIVVLAIEARDGQSAQDIARTIEREFGRTYRNFLVTIHPDDIAGEVAGKGANIGWAGQQAQRRIDELGIPYDRIIVSTFDADSVAHPQYFSYLTHAFLTHPDRLHTSYQPIPLFHNNVWDAMALMRVVATSTTFWLLGDTMRPDRLFTFSSHSMPFQALVDVGFWQTDVVSEDSRIFLQCLIRYDGRYTVTPMYIPISMDTIQAQSVWRSLVNQYKQIRRWAYGVENFPFMVWNFLHDRAMSRRLKLKYVWNQFEGTFSWATAPLLILIMGWLPFHFPHPELEQSVLAQNAPVVLQRLMIGAMTGLVVAAVISTAMLPRPSHGTPWYQWLIMVLQWVFLPVTMIVFGALPALEAQTRLMLGKYLGFWVSEKVRSDQSSTLPTKPG